MLIIISFILGLLVGVVLTLIVIQVQRVGNLVINFSDPLDEKPFLLELKKDINTVYKKKYISLKVCSDYCKPHR